LSCFDEGLPVLTGPLFYVIFVVVDFTLAIFVAFFSCFFVVFSLFSWFTIQLGIWNFPQRPMRELLSLLL
jgi:hypothetical protein